MAALQRLLDPTASIDVRRRTTEELTVAAISEVVAHADVLTWYSSAMGELDAALAAADRVPTGSPGGLYDDELFTEERGRLTVYLPSYPPTAQRNWPGRVASLTIAPTNLAVTVHRGDHSTST